MRGGARPNSGRKRKHIKLADVIRNHCEDFIIEMLKNDEIKGRALREIQQLILFEEEVNLKEEYIYIIKSNDAYKIGYTTNIKSRITDYVINLGLVEIIYIYKGFNCYDLENTLHNLVKEKNIRGEWFDLNNNDIINIVKYCSKLIS